MDMSYIPIQTKPNLWGIWSFYKESKKHLINRNLGVSVSFDLFDVLINVLHFWYGSKIGRYFWIFTQH